MLSKVSAPPPCPPFPRGSFPLKEKERGEIRDVTDKAAVYQKEKKRMENLEEVMPGLYHQCTSSRTERWESDRASAESRSKTCGAGAHTAGVPTPSTAQEGRGRILWIQSTPRPRATRPRATRPRAESRALHCPSADLPANLPFSPSPNRLLCPLGPLSPQRPARL